MPTSRSGSCLAQINHVAPSSYYNPYQYNYAGTSSPCYRQGTVSGMLPASSNNQSPSYLQKAATFVHNMIHAQTPTPTATTVPVDSRIAVATSRGTIPGCPCAKSSIPNAQVTIPGVIVPQGVQKQPLLASSICPL